MTEQRLLKNRYRKEYEQLYVRGDPWANEREESAEAQAARLEREERAKAARQIWQDKAELEEKNMTWYVNVSSNFGRGP